MIASIFVGFVAGEIFDLQYKKSIGQQQQEQKQSTKYDYKVTFF